MLRFKFFVSLLCLIFLMSCEKDIAVVQEDIREDQVEERVPPIYIDDITVTLYQTIPSSGSFHRYNVYLCEVWTAVNSIELYIQGSGSAIVHLGQAQQVGLDDYHFRLDKSIYTRYPSGDLVMRASYSPTSYSNPLCPPSYLDQDCDVCHPFTLP